MVIVYHIFHNSALCFNMSPEIYMNLSPEDTIREFETKW